MFSPLIRSVASPTIPGLTVQLLKFLTMPSKRELSELHGPLLAVAAAALLMTLVILTKSK